MTLCVRSLYIAVLILSFDVSGARGAGGTAGWPPEYLKNLPADRLERAYTSVEHAYSFTQRLKFSDAAGSDLLAVYDEKHNFGLLPFSAAGIGAFMFNKQADIDMLNRYFASDRLARGDFNAASPSGFGAFSMTQLRFYGLFNSRCGILPGKLAVAAEQNLEAAMLKVLNDYARLSYTQLSPQDYWNGSQNRYVPSIAGYLLVAQWLRNSPAHKSFIMKDGSTLQQQYQGWRGLTSKFLDRRIKSGLWKEVGIGYEDNTIMGILNIRDFAEDPVIRKKAEMLLDLHFASRAEETLLNTHGGPKSRVKGQEPYLGEFEDHRDYNLLFGLQEHRTEKGVPFTVFATSDYLPPPAIMNLAADSQRRGTYTFAKRWPGPGVMSDGTARDDEGQLVPSGWATQDPVKTVLRYGFVGSNYIMGSVAQDGGWWGIQKGEDKSGPTLGGDAHRWEGVTFKVAGKAARIGFEVKPNCRNWHAWGQFAALQDRNVLITQRWVPESLNGPKCNPSFLKIYFSQTIDEVADGGNGWIFAQSGAAYSALKIVAGGYKWVKAGFGKDDPTVTTPTTWSHRDSVNLKDLKFVLMDTDAPAILIVNDAADYGSDFAKFKEALKAQPVIYDAAAHTTKFANLTFLGPAALGKIDGKTVELAPKLGYDSPFIRSEWDSGLVYIRKGDATEILDVRDPNNPVKTVGVKPDERFPAGTGHSKPVIF